MGKDLSRRVSDRASEVGTYKTLADEIQAKRAYFAEALPQGLEVRQLMRDCLNMVAKVPNLLRCESSTVIGALMTSAQLGLRPGVLGESFVLPFWSSRLSGYQAQLIIGYRGFVKLAFQSGRVQGIHGEEIHEFDRYGVSLGTNRQLVHEPKLTDRGDPIAYYATITYASGGTDFHLMSLEAVETHRDRFATTRTRAGKIYGPWVDHFDSMAKKTCIRMGAKTWPLSTGERDLPLAAALQVDGSVRKSIDAPLVEIAAGEEIEPEHDVAADAAPSPDDVPTDPPPGEKG